MLEVDLDADARHQSLTFDQGIDKALILLNNLSRLPAFKFGWEVNGVRLNDNKEGFVKVLEQVQERDGPDGGYHFVVVESARGPLGAFPPAESYLAEIDFKAVLGNLFVRVSMTKPVATFETILGIVKVLNAWSDLQHVSAVPAFYVGYDSPIDDTSRRGIGWAGWVPFRLTAADLPEAGYLEAIGPGTFVASQNSYWEVTDRAAAKRAQALELKLNSLGMLPTFKDLAKGTWGQTP